MGDGHGPNEVTYLSIDVKLVPAGIYELTIRLRDLISGEERERATLLRIDD